MNQCVILLGTLVTIGALNASPRSVFFANLNKGLNPIVGGMDSDLNHHPFIVSLQRGSSGHYCGGSLIDKSHVLTAGHCVDFLNAQDITVVIGSKDVETIADTAEKIKVTKIVTHPNFENSWSSLTYDYAILTLEKDSQITPATLIAQDAKPFDVASDGLSTVIGWGTTSEGGSLSNSLLEVTVPLVSNEKCAEAYPGQINDSMLCAGLEDGGKDSCQGDSGGPLVVSDLNGKDILTGIVSWGEGCARPNKYGVYSNIALVRTWIDEQLETVFE